jgi:Fe-S-cluster containining protein
MKEATYLAIIDNFDHWAEKYAHVCAKGCSCCCTGNVTITALEGERILGFAVKNGMEQWLADRLRQLAQAGRPRMTTNEFAHACLSGREADPGTCEKLTPCPFLADDVCRIYPVRPFSCRCFISISRCSATQPAQIDECYLTASTAMLQLIEHLGQKEYWGIMTDVLLSLLDISTYQGIATALADPARIMEGRLRTLTARPLPGFLFTEEEEHRIEPLLHAIFSSRIGSGSVEDVLNGRTPTDNGPGGQAR